MVEKRMMSKGMRTRRMMNSLNKTADNICQEEPTDTEVTLIRVKGSSPNG